MAPLSPWVRKLILGLKALVVVVLLSYLFSCVAMVRERGRRTWCLSHLKQIGLAFNLYAAAHKEAEPTHIMELAKYIGGEQNVRMFSCPTHRRHYKGTPITRLSQIPANPDYIGYDYLSVTSAIPSKLASLTVIPVMCDKPGNHGEDGITILFKDGHAAWWSGNLESYAASNSLTITINTTWLN
jgi:hypothetical protein